ncbi:unnamed protein product [Cuscuta epithymum]|uniref:Inhibitor I9 domain-containing protein n=1 Tax=Cuscuta epithymum TaxID=186058 RepID=A0AAV0CST0_9ASTE|nr:unnamed protein product [Cuscuta epithymum]CAH9136208.1 unnamed protein product [Cuscuta epithymum]
MPRPIAFTPFFFSLLVITLSATIAIVSSLDYSKPYIVLTEKPDENPQTHYIKMLTSLFGSEIEAKKSLLYVYEYATQGFVAILTPEEASRLSKYPGVLSVAEDQLVAYSPSNEVKDDTSSQI